MKNVLIILPARRLLAIVGCSVGLTMSALALPTADAISSKCHAGIREEYDVRRYGAVADGKTINTEAIQRTIDACAAGGGGRVLISGGVYLTGTLILKNGIELHVAAGACLRGSPNWWDWKDQPLARHINQYMCTRHRSAALIFADEAENVAITGRGTVDGNGFAFVEEDVISKSGQLKRKFGLDKSPPRLVFLTGCRRVKIDDIRVLYPPAGWSFWIHDCDDVVVHGIEIYSDVNFPNNDGIHVNCSRDVRISDCLIETGDDSIIVRANSASLATNKPCERVVVNNCILRSYSCGIRVGWLNDGEIRNCAFSNLVIHDSVCGIGIFLPDGGPRETISDQGREATFVENLSFSDIVMDRIVARPIYVHISSSSNTQVRAVKDLLFSNLMVRGLMYPIVSSPRKGVVSDITFSNCRFVKEKAGSPGYPDRPEVGFSGCQRFWSDVKDGNVERIVYRNAEFK